MCTMQNYKRYYTILQTTLHKKTYPTTQNYKSCCTKTQTELQALHTSYIGHVMCNNLCALFCIGHSDGEERIYGRTGIKLQI